jgi:cobyric acid synthase
VEKIGFGENVKEYAMHSIICGSLQMIASRLVNQGTQEAQAQSDFFQAYNVLQEHRKEMRTREAVTAPVRGIEQSVLERPDEQVSAFGVLARAGPMPNNGPGWKKDSED